MSADPPPPSAVTTTPQSQERTLRIGTRSSTLALAQVDLFKTLLTQSQSPSLSQPQSSHPIKTTIHPLSTSLGDTNKTTALHTLASTGKSLWTEDLETELLANRVDVLIHSLKDVPTKLPLGCKVRAVGRREMPHDCVLLSPTQRKLGRRGLADLGEGGVVGTSSVRRTAMLRRRYPGLRVKDCRGNVPTRIRKLEDPKAEEEVFDALILAAAGVQRLGLMERVDEVLSWEKGMGHAVGQGALGVEWRVGDEWIEGILRGVEATTGSRGRWEGEAERALLRVLEGGCSVPVGVGCAWDVKGEGAGGEREGDGNVEGDGEEGSHEKGEGDEDASVKGEQQAGGDSSNDAEWLTLLAMVVSVDGQRCVQGSRRQLVSSDEEAEECGINAAKELIDKGAGEILKEIELNRGMLRDQDNA